MRRFEADSPFLSIHGGDLILQGPCPGVGLKPRTRWRVVKVQHIVLPDMDTDPDERRAAGHKLIVYCSKDAGGA